MARPRIEEDVERPVFRYRKPVRGSAVWWLRFLGVAAFAIILLRLPQEQEVQFSRIDLRWLGFCMLLTVLQLLIEAFIWYWLLKLQRIRYAYPKTLQAYLASQYLGLVTPGHVGEFLGAGYISMDTGITFGYALASVVLRKLIAWVATVSLGIWGLQMLVALPFSQGVKWAALATIGVVLILAAGMAVWILSLRRLAKKWARLSVWQLDMTEFRAGLKTLLTPRLVIPVLLTLVSMCLLFLQLEAVLHALGIELPFLRVAQIMAFSRIVARVVPISVVGFGTKDAAIIGMLALEKIEPAVGLAATVLLLVCSYLVTLLLSGLAWWVKPLVIRRAAPSS